MKRFFLLMAAALISITAAFSKEQIENEEDTIYLSLQETEITATRVSKDSPVAHTEISPETISRNNYGYDIPSLIALTPSVVMTTETGTCIGASSIRLRGSDATRINATINGMPLNNPDSHSMYWYDTPDLVSSVGGIQVQRGAGTSTNGTGSFGGALSMRTAQISKLPAGEVSLSYGSFNTNKEYVHVCSGLFAGSWAADIRLSHIGSAGYVDRGSTELLSYMAQAGWEKRGNSVKFISFGGKAKTYLTYTGVSPEDIAAYGPRYHTSGQYSTSDGPFILTDGTHVNYYDDQTDNYLQFNNQIIFNHSFSKQWSVNLTGYYTYGDGYYRQYKDDAWLAGYNNLPTERAQADLIRDKVMRNHRFGLNAAGSFISDDIELIFGASCDRYICPHYGTILWIDGVEPSVYENFIWFSNDTDKSDGNIFAKVTWRPAKGLNLYADIQWRHVDYRIGGSNDNYDWRIGQMQEISVDKRYDFINPRLGARYSLADKHSFSASFSMAGKEPTRSDFTDRYNFSSLVEEPLCETLFDFELGYEFKSAIFAGGINAYYMQYRNQLVPTGIVNDSSDNLNINVPDSFRRGLELTALCQPLKWLSLSASCTLSQNMIDDYCETIDGREFKLGRTTIAYSPSVIAKGAADFRIGPFESSIRCNCVSSQFMSNGNFDDLVLPAYAVADLDFAYTYTPAASFKSIRFAIHIGNLFNSHYCSYGYGGSYLNGETLDSRGSWMMLFPQAGINLLSNITVRF